MKKQSPHARKCAARQRTANYLAAQATHAQAEATHAQVEASLRQQIRADVRGLQIDAGIHSFAGNDANRLIDRSGRLCMMTLGAAAIAGYHADHPDMRIVRGMAEALGDLRARPQDIERHRRSVQSGLAAIDRLLLECDDLALAYAASELDRLLQRPEGVGTADMQAILGVTA